MLVKFAVDPAALDAKALEKSLSVALHRSVIESWREVGVFVHAGARLKESPFLEHIDKLPASLKSLWIKALKVNKRVACSTAWSGDFGDTPEAHLDLFADLDLALLESAKVTFYADVEDHEHSVLMPGFGDVELCRFHSAEQSIRLTQAKVAQNTSLLCGSSNSEGWRKRYAAWLRICDQIVVVDRYGMHDYLRSVRKYEKPGLARLFDSVRGRGVAAPANIVLFLGDPKIAEDVSTCIEDFKGMVGQGIREITVHVIDDRAFRQHGHHRYMRCDYAVFGFDRGIGAFSGDVAQANCVLWRRDRATDPVFDNTENALRIEGRRYRLTQD